MKTSKRVLIVKFSGGRESKITIPADSKVTFGPALPGPSSRGFAPHQMEYALRIYQGQTEKSGLLAVFTEVREFSDSEEIQKADLVVRESGKSLWRSDETGFETTTRVKRSKAMLPDSL